ncbi:terminase small subunit [Jeotgalibaca porci]|uniref:terminase small subunit n=1 Tax=Jeotgalibaca porci TaxID=1868793 RepID=UPI0035A07BDD
MYQSALNAGYSANYAKAQSHKLLENVGIKIYLEERMKEISDKSIADQTEVMQYLTRLMRGEETETEMINVGSFEQELVEVPVKHNIRKQAAELIGKRYALWTDKLDAKVDNNIKITLGDYDDDD